MELTNFSLCLRVTQKKRTVVRTNNSSPIALMLWECHSDVEIKGLLLICSNNDIDRIHCMSCKAPVIVVVKDESNGDPAEPECQRGEGEEPDVAHLKQTTINKTQMNDLTQNGR